MRNPDLNSLWRSLARMIIMLRSPIWPASRKGPLAIHGNEVAQVVG